MWFEVAASGSISGIFDAQRALFYSTARRPGERDHGASRTTKPDVRTLVPPRSRRAFPIQRRCHFPRLIFFFKKPHAPTSLPSPAEVIQVASQSADPNATETTRPLPVRFPSMGLLVNYGTEVTIAEAQCLLLIRKTISHTVSVPEVFVWCKDNNEVFIYMELVDGITPREELGNVSRGRQSGDLSTIATYDKCMA